MYRGDWGSKLLFKARSGTLEVKGSSRDEQDQYCSLCIGEEETIEHLIVACDRYEEERQGLLASVVEIIGEEEWHSRLEEEDGEVPC